MLSLLSCNEIDVTHHSFHMNTRKWKAVLWKESCQKFYGSISYKNTLANTISSFMDNK